MIKLATHATIHIYRTVPLFWPKFHKTGGLGGAKKRLFFPSKIVQNSGEARFTQLFGTRKILESGNKVFYLLG